MRLLTEKCVRASTLGCLVAALAMAVATGYQPNAWADGSGPAAPGTPGVAPAPAAAAPVASSSPAAAPTPVPPLSSPSMVGPLQMASPNEINLPKMVPFLSDLPAPIATLFDFDVNGVISGLGMVQNHPVPGDFTDQVDVSNAQLFIQKADGLIQYYLQVGGYSIPALGTAYVNLGHAVNALYGPLPVAYLKIAPTGNFSIMAGNLPTLIGAEYTFTFENMNIERGLLWNQESAVSRGVQLNYSQGPLAGSLSWNNGYYSHSYTWVTGSLAYTINSANTLSFIGGGNVGFAKSNNFATPLYQNNGQIYNLIYEYNAAPWILEPYLQWNIVPHNGDIGVYKTTSAGGPGILGSYAFTDNFFMVARWEFEATSGNSSDGSANLLYGPGSDAWSLTFTPTYQYKQFFVRAEASYVQAMGYTYGDTFGHTFRNPSELRGLIETGIIF